jgi:hypothetical protein
MRSLTPMLASASAAALTTLAVTVAVPAIADDASSRADGVDAFAACLRTHGLDGAPGGAAVKPWLGARMERGDVATRRVVETCSPERTIAVRGPSEQQLRSCLAAHGVDLAGGDGRALKQWVLEHGDDAANRAAMKVCGMAPVTKARVAGTCLEAPPKGAAIPGTRARKGQPAQ